MITSRVGVLGACFLVCFLICSITPISALEMGSMENNTITSSFADVETLDNLTSSELGGLYYTNNIHRPNDPPDKKIIYIAVGVTLLIIAIIIGVYCLSQYLSASRTATHVLERVAYLSAAPTVKVKFPNVRMTREGDLVGMPKVLTEQFDLHKGLTLRKLDSLRMQLSQRVAPEQMASELKDIPYEIMMRLLGETGDPDYIARIAVQTTNEPNILNDIPYIVPALDKDMTEIMELRGILGASDSFIDGTIPVENIASLLSTKPHCIPAILTEIFTRDPVKANLLKEELIRMGKYLPPWKLQLYPPWCYK